MKHNYFRFILLCLCLLAGMNAFAYDAEIDGIYYNFSGSEATVTNNGNIYSGTVVIPESVTYNGKIYSVTRIGDNAFTDCSRLTSITIPGNVTSIGIRAFKGCNGLEKVIILDIAVWCSMSFTGDYANPLSFAGHLYSNETTEITSLVIPINVTSIGDYAFVGCRGLTSVTIPNSVTSIGDGAFRECTGLTSITIPNSVTSIGSSVFYGCTGLTSINIPNSVTSIGSSAFAGTAWYNNQPDGVVYAGEVAYKYKGTMPEGTEVILKEGLVGIAESAFYGCSGLTSITIPNSVTSIGNCAFQGCRSLTSVTIPNSVTYIGSSAFEGCYELNYNEYMDARYIGNNDNPYFCLISASSPYWIHQECRIISSGAFENANRLTYIRIPDNVTCIGRSAFEGCSGLTSITIPSSVSFIDLRAFGGCDNLTSIDVEAGNTTYDSRENCNAIIESATNTLITGCKNTIIPNNVTSIGIWAFLDCHGLTSIAIPSSVTSIGNSAFQGCSGLTSIIIPNSVTAIDGFAFYECIGLTSVTIPNSVVFLKESAFQNCSSMTSIYIGNGVTRIPWYTFYGCSSLKSVTIGKNVTCIEESAFRNCNNLTSVICLNETPPSMEFRYGSIYDSDSDPFSNRANITVYVPAGSKVTYEAADNWKRFKEIVEIASPYIEFADANVKALCVANWDTNGDSELSEAEAAMVTDLGTVFMTNTTITSFNELQYFTGLTSIASYAFIGCTALASLTIPSNVTNIGDYAFMNCSSLTSLTCLATNPPTVSALVFPSNLKTIYVPIGSVGAYKAANIWKDFFIIGITDYMIDDNTASLDIAEEESGKSVIFTHNFNREWESIYLPFAINYDAIKADFDLAEIDGVVQNDDNNDGNIDFTVLSIRGFKEQMTEPNTPYLIRAKNAGNQTISFDDITVYPTEEATFDCSSFSTKYEFTGSYNALDASALAERYSIQNGELVKGTSSLAPCRWYMTATSRKGAPLNLPNKIRIMSVDEVITGVSSLGETEKGAVIYNLNGQRLTKPQKGINIQNGRKVLLK